MADPFVETFGIKHISEANWREADAASSSFAHETPDGGFSQTSGEDWARFFLEPTLTDNTPVDVAKLYEVARGTAICGYLFYPLYTLCSEQLTRIGEAAIVHRCMTVAGGNRKLSFEKRIDLLLSNGVFDQAQADDWHRLRDLRNFTSHPVEQSILPPGGALSLLHSMAERINALFPD